MILKVPLPAGAEIVVENHLFDLIVGEQSIRKMTTNKAGAADNKKLSVFSHPSNS
jgi:hypothetical protein